MMNRFFAFAAGLVVAAALMSPPAALATTIHGVQIHNETNKCAWLTIYSSNDMMTPFSIVPKSPRFIKPGEVFKWTFQPLPAEIKVRAEVTANADCSGGRIYDSYDVFKAEGGHNVGTQTARLRHNGATKYSLFFYH